MSNAGPLLDVRELTTRFRTENGTVHAVNGVSFALEGGESLAVVGESGSGKSVAMLSIMGLIASPPGHIESGTVLFRGRDLLTLSAREMRQVRGADIAMVFQDPMTSLNPVLTVGLQITEAIRAHHPLGATAARERAIEYLELVGIAAPRQRIDDYPHQFSGGQRQRVGIAMALCCEPDLLIADEPTTALDVTIQAQITELVADLQRRLGMAVIWITHDLGVVAGFVDRVAVMYAGSIVEMAPVADLYAHPSHPYTRGLLESIPSVAAVSGRLVPIPGSPPDLLAVPEQCAFVSRCPVAGEQCASRKPVLDEVTEGHHSACWHWRKLPGAIAHRAERQVQPGVQARVPRELLLEVRDLETHFPVRRGVLRRTVGYVKAVDGVSLGIARGETLGLVGESGCGKSTMGQSILQLVRYNAGAVLLNGRTLADLDRVELRSARRDMQMIFQDPYASLNPRMTAGNLVGEALRIHSIGARNERMGKVLELLELVGLDRRFVNRYPHEFSGGQRQRIGIARALATSPSFIVADEPISALDVSIQAQIVNLLQDLKQRLALTYLFIAHDLAMVRYISDRVAVMYLGRIVEIGGKDDVFDRPLHPYTRALLSAIPVPDPAARSGRRRIIVEGDVPNPAAPPPGCPFHPRCPHAEPGCSTEQPLLREFGNAHEVACHLAESIG